MDVIIDKLNKGRKNVLEYVKNDYDISDVPVFTEKDVTYVWIRVNNIYMVSVQKGNPNVAMVLTFLYKVRDVFKSYFKELEDESLRDNFVITYELLDEMMKEDPNLNLYSNLV